MVRGGGYCVSADKLIFMHVIDLILYSICPIHRLPASSYEPDMTFPRKAMVATAL